ncbi:MAG: nickel pincer cofactor biosynthesis protein LarC [Lachnospiraceae bacterium]|nr:nickel pincer cofactor biosynthesis protein LarC [Lachnospiraceae bacterium]
MRTLYLDCSMGAAGDMLMGALYSLLPEEEQRNFIKRFGEMGLPEVELQVSRDMKCGIAGTHMSVVVHGTEEDESRAHHHSHRTLDDVCTLIQNLQVSDKVKSDVTAIYQKIAEAESRVHNTSVAEVHFHEVGMLDAIADVTGCAMLMEQLEAERVVVSPINVGQGQVTCAHGVLSVPAPATVILLEDMLCYGGDVEGELCTPTGAALLSYYKTECGPMPVMKMEQVGYGSGKKDYPVANVLRAILGESTQETSPVVEICCNIDDMTGEEIGFACELLLQEGALEVYTTAVEMKKNRPGILLTVLCSQEQVEYMEKLLLQHTSTIGLRKRQWDRTSLKRESRQVTFSLGQVNVKVSTGYGVTKQKVEYDDLRNIAGEHGLSLRQVKEVLYQETGIGKGE